MGAHYGVPGFNPALRFLFFGIGGGMAEPVGCQLYSLLRGKVAFMHVAVSHISSGSEVVQGLDLIANNAAVQC
jgi:hypothetical protein